jgi:hypothetical protein
VHKDVDGHDTEYNSLSPEPTLGLDTFCQVVPSHAVTNVCCKLPSPKSPTAVQEVADTHETDLRVLLSTPANGTGSRVQTLPSQTIVNIKPPAL